MKGGTPGVYILSQATQEIFGSTAQLFPCSYGYCNLLPTTVGLIVSTAEFFNERFPTNQLQGLCDSLYLDWICHCQLGLDAIIKYSIPVLVILYPITIAIVRIVIVQQIRGSF